MKSLLTYRLINFYCFLITIILLAAAAYLQFVMFMHPCPLCIIQRIVVGILLLFFLIGSIYLPSYWGRKIYGFLIILISLVGVFFAGRQIYLQHLPPDVAPLCSPPLNVLLHKIPLKDTLKILLQGSGECTEVTWHFLNLSMPEWTLLFFIFFALAGIFQMIKKTD